MPIEVKLAKLSPTMESGQLVKWLVKEGDQVKEGDSLAEVQTDKAVMPMEAFDEGTVALLDVNEGDDVDLGQRVLVLAASGEDPKEIAEQMKGEAEKPAAKPEKGKAEEAEEAEEAEGDEAEAAPKKQTKRAASAQPNGQDRKDRAAQGATATAAPSAGDGGRIRSSPLARKIAASEGIDLAQVEGSGPRGRIIRRDVEEFLKQGKAAPTPSAAPRVAAQAREPQRIPHSRMRKTIADRMIKAKQQAPEIHLTAEIRMDQIVAIRERLNKQLAKQDVKLSVGDFITKAVAVALRRHPGVNASFEPDAIVQHGEVNLGIAVALEGGLIVPVLPNADLLGLVAIRQGTQALADAARQNKLSSKQMMGATFTISNLGMYGVRQFDAILNLPEVGILAVGATEQRPVVENGQLGVGHVMTVTLTADHRAVDGATAAEFMRTLKGLLEEPTAMLL